MHIRRRIFYEWWTLVVLHWALILGELTLLFQYAYSPLGCFCSPHANYVCVALHFLVALGCYKIHFYLIQRAFPHRYDTVSLFLYEDFSELN